MKISEVISEFVPCEICGNNDIRNFYFHVLVDKGSQPYVKCCECEKEYYSASAKNILERVDELKKIRNESITTLEKTSKVNPGDKEPLHPLVKVLAQM